jgi:hypothetical protein
MLEFYLFISQLKMTAMDFMGKFIAVAFKQLMKVESNKGL